MLGWAGLVAWQVRRICMDEASGVDRANNGVDCPQNSWRLWAGLEML